MLMMVYNLFRCLVMKVLEREREKEIDTHTHTHAHTDRPREWPHHNNPNTAGGETAREAPQE